MLYVSTRDYINTYTAHRALFELSASDGGMFVPFRLPKFTQDELSQMRSNSFGANVANVLNLFFSERLTGWDVDCCCGRCPVNIISLPRKLLVAELWHNTESSYTHIERALYDKLCGGHAPEQISRWAKIAIGIAFLFAVYAISTTEEFDIALDDSEFIAPLSAFYARCMGLPVGVIVCGSYDNGAIWDLLHRGELNTAICNQNLGLEQMIYTTLGAEEVSRFVSSCQNCRTYYLQEEQLKELNDRIFVAVISADRINNVIVSFYRSNNHLIDRSAAIGYGALQDYRASVGESRHTMLFSMQKPQADSVLK